jgi:CelD/BcsL family acetyltransferase involved in cellulose biosynthesis
MQVRLTESRDRLPIDRAQWNALVERNRTRSAFQTFEWFDTWWAAFGPRHRLFLLSVHQAQSVIGIAPLMLVHGPLGLRQLEFTGSPNADYQDLILPYQSNAAIDALCQFLHGARDRWDMIVLRNLPADTPTVSELGHGFGRVGHLLMDMERQPCPALQIRGREREIELLLNRYSIRRAMRRLAARGAISYRALNAPDEVTHYLPLFFRQHVQRRQGTRHPSPFANPVFCNWYSNLARAASSEGWLHFSMIDCGGKPAAFHFGFSHGGVLSWYKPSFNPEFSGESPGTTLISHLIRDAIERGLGELDFSSGLEPFKYRFSNIRRECLNLRVFANPALHFAFMSGARLRRVAREWWHRSRKKVDVVKSAGCSAPLPR